MARRIIALQRRLNNSTSDKKDGCRKEANRKTATKFNLKGNRIVNLSQLSKEISKLLNHKACCPKGGSPKMEREIKRYGLCSSLSFKCNECGISIIVDLQPKESRGRLGKRHSINVASVWRFVSTGGGHAKMDEILSVMSIPSIDRRNFHSTEMFITKEWRQQLAQEMLERGKEERRLAMECGENDGVPAIDVIVDGGWSVRSSHHRYSAKSGVACIIGRETNKLLFSRCQK